jgi:hypothetical protein
LLIGGGLNASVLLNVASFQSNGGNNTLAGGADLDLFYGLLPSNSNTPDKTDRNPAQGEIFVTPKSDYVPITLNATLLSSPSLTLDGTQQVSSASSQTLALQPGDHYLYGPGGTGVVHFTVSPTGKVAYDSSLDGILSLSGAGTTLNVNGAAVTINGAALATPDLLLDYVSWEKAATPFTVRLLPGGHLLEGEGGTGAVWFTVNRDGTVGYEKSLGGILGGATTRTLVVNGAAININATALASPDVLLDYATWEKSRSAFSVRLLPGSHVLEGEGGTGAVWFTVNRDGTVGYEKSLGGILGGATTRTLVVNGAAVTINASALKSTELIVDYATAKASSTPFTLRYLPGVHLITYDGSTIAFNINKDGLVDYSTSLDNILSGRGTRTLTLRQR